MVYASSRVYSILTPLSDLQKNRLKNQCHGILTWIYEFRPGNKIISVVFDEEFELSGPRTPKLSPDQVV